MPSDGHHRNADDTVGRLGEDEGAARVWTAVGSEGIMMIGRCAATPVTSQAEARQGRSTTGVPVARERSGRIEGPPVLALSIGVGTAIGTALGAATESMGPWLALGVGLGAAIGAGLMARTGNGGRHRP
jgi:hypothetical protein